MEAYIAFGVFVVLAVAAMFGKGMYDDWKKKKRFIHKLYHEYGNPPVKEYRPEQYESISHYFRKHPQEGQIDDITWNDLSFDDIFKRLNDTYSSAGEEYLYHTLRTPFFEEERLKHLDELEDYFRTHEDNRVQVQYLMSQLGKTGKFSLYDYLEYLDILGERKNTKHILQNFLFIPCIVLCFFLPSYGLVSLCTLMIWNMTTYFKEKNEIDPYIISFAYVMRLLRTADKLGRMQMAPCAEELQSLNEHKKELGRFRRGSFWLMSSGRMSGSGNPLDILLDYFRMIFHLDLMKFNNMLKQVRLHTQDVDAMIGTVGYLETVIAIGAYRKAMEGNWSRPVFHKQSGLLAEEVYHPMIAEPVKNSIDTKKGVLLTGSNASGKSTFLKTIAVNAILAQTIYTCPALRYEGEFYSICSSMSLRDDLSGGDSYYIVEIKSIKRILDIAARSPHRVLCFVDEVLRGTNTVERIAASTQILKSLASENVICFAATHDIELTELLASDYNNYHFKEEVEDGDVRFDYKLLSGKATTRNAIKLLGIMGYDETIIEKANRQAEEFVKTGVWSV